MPPNTPFGYIPLQYPLAEEKNLTIAGHILPNLSIIGDRDGLIRLFVNLLGNAIKYTEQGHITISFNRETAEFVEITVADTGIGVAPDHLPYIFDRFCRVDTSRATSGAGLAIALSVAQVHGGTISVTSQIGVGTEFLVQLAKEHHKQ